MPSFATYLQAPELFTGSPLTRLEAIDSYGIGCVLIDGACVCIPRDESARYDSHTSPLTQCHVHAVVNTNTDSHAPARLAAASRAPPRAAPGADGGGGGGGAAPSDCDGGDATFTEATALTSRFAGGAAARSHALPLDGLGFPPLRPKPGTPCELVSLCSALLCRDPADRPAPAAAAAALNALAAASLDWGFRDAEQPRGGEAAAGEPEWAAALAGAAAAGLASDPHAPSACHSRPPPVSLPRLSASARVSHVTSSARVSLARGDTLLHAVALDVG